jgi:UTP--glucose-1-phosphate uridylyltransferase
MVDVYEKHTCSVLAVEQVPHAETEKYGIVSIDSMHDRIGHVQGIVEKPHPNEAPSDFGVVGRYILTPRIFELIESTGKGSGGEIQLTDAIARLMQEETVLAYQFNGQRYDCGSKLGYLQATVEYALKHPELKNDFHNYLQNFCLPNIETK